MQSKEDQKLEIEEAVADFAEGASRDDIEYEYLDGHASSRTYWRLYLGGGSGILDRDDSSILAMVLPEDRGGSEEGTRDPEVADLQTLPFLDVQRYLADIDMDVPEIDYVDLERGILLLEDLGDEHFEDVVVETAGSTTGDLEERKEAVAGYYREAIDVVVDLQQKSLQTAIQDDSDEQCVAFRRHFDWDELRWELDHYLQWGLKAQYGDDVVRTYEEELNDIFDELAGQLAEMPKTVALRDFQSRNLLRKNDEWHLIDFQDALTAPYLYDLVSLLRDSYVAPDADQIDELVQHYHTEGEHHRLPWCVGERNIWRDFHLQTIQRKLKDAGRFVYIEKEKGDSSFLQYYDRSIRFVSQAIEGVSGYGRLEEILDEVEPAFEKTEHGVLG
jgi:aminoglycoside/choline kinase family phosphotransferase